MKNFNEQLKLAFNFHKNKNINKALKIYLNYLKLKKMILNLLYLIGTYYFKLKKY